MSLQFIKEIAPEGSNLSHFLDNVIYPRSQILPDTLDKLKDKRSSALFSAILDTAENGWPEYYKYDEIHLINQPKISISWHFGAEFSIDGLERVCRFCDVNNISRPDIFIFTDDAVSRDGFLQYNLSAKKITKPELLKPLRLGMAPWVIEEVSNHVANSSWRDTPAYTLSNIKGFKDIPIIFISVTPYEFCDHILTDHPDDACFRFIVNGGRQNTSSILQPGAAWLLKQLAKLRCTYLITDKTIKSKFINDSLYKTYETLKPNKGVRIQKSLLQEFKLIDFSGEEIASQYLYKIKTFF